MMLKRWDEIHPTVAENSRTHLKFILFIRSSGTFHIIVNQSCTIPSIYRKILFCEIKWIEASRSYCYIHTTKQNKLIATCPMAEVKKKLPPDLFIQIHRSYIINKKCVNKFVGNAVYIDEESFRVSRKFKPMVLDQFLFLENPKDKPENDFQKDTEEERTD